MIRFPLPLLASAALTCASLLAAPAANATSAGRTEFEILMNGKPVGRHIVTVTEAGDTVRARISIDMQGRVGPIGFTYAHRCDEVWQGDTLQSMNCTDRQNRTAKSVNARREGAGLTVDGTGFRGPAPGGVMPSSWWRSATVRQTQLLDSRDGKLSRVTATRRGEESIDTAGGPVRATRWSLRGAVNTDVWYDAQGRWVKTAFRLSGQSFVYRKLSSAGSAPRG